MSAFKFTWSQGQFGDVTKSEDIALTSTAVSQDTTVNNGSTQEDSVTDAATSQNAEDSVLTKPTVTPTASKTTTVAQAITSTMTSKEKTSPPDQTTISEDETRTDSGVEDVTSITFGENYYATEIPPPGVECRDRERYYKCVPNCRQSCFNYDNYEVACPDLCIPGCFCDPGLVVDQNGKCVETFECIDYSCKDKEDWWECKPKNHNTCENFARAEAKQDFDCEPGCFCKEGLIQAPDGSCVEPYNCPKPACGDNEIATDCVNACNTCEANCHICGFMVCIPGCDCMDGFKRDANGTCIHAYECPVCPPPTTTTAIDTTTTVAKVETTTPLPKAKTTAPVSKAKTTTSLPKAETATPVTKARTTTSVPKAETATPVTKAKTTTPLPKAKTTAAVSKAETTTPVPKAEATPSPQKVETSTIPTAVNSTTLLTPGKTAQTPVGTTTKIPLATAD